MQQPTPGANTTTTSSAAATTSNARNTGGGGLARFRSAPATWLEALLEEDDEGEEGVDDSLEALKPTESLTQLLSSSSSNPINYISGGGGEGGQGFNVAGDSRGDLGVFESSNNAAFLRQNSSPADLFGGGYDGFFGNYGQEYLSTPSPAGAKRAREPHQSARFSAQLKGEQSGSGQFQDGVSGYLDLEMDKLLEDSVPCRVRAKRGCATHPRSIAERVRRTRISDRIRKLQDLVPNMDKQTNTADMLDEAVEYVKYLQKQIKELTDHQKKCKCSSNEHHQ